MLADLSERLLRALQPTDSFTVTETQVEDALKGVCNALLVADVPVAQVRGVRDRVLGRVAALQRGVALNGATVLRAALREELRALVDPGVPAYQPARGKRNVLMLVGLQGAGKTTTVTKLAHWYRRKGFKPGIICADTFRAGALPQLTMSATRAKIPYYGNPLETDPVVVVREGLRLFVDEGTEKFDLIIVDTSGRHKQEDELFTEMETLTQVAHPDCTVLVMDASIGQMAFDQAQAFKNRVPVGAVIITKMDGHAKGGGALSAVAATGSPIIFIGTGAFFFAAYGWKCSQVSTYPIWSLLTRSVSRGVCWNQRGPRWIWRQT
eukprot:TRINITY_DN9180_c0_g1_i1.p1 TRINITY_DN9180_c0_g1~~TRINITY_DN9180_c0_g1_i1.p1  ORF type:complete len:323 (-),score=52.02 TRINITY_DN9180_c0_g1_i1:517-1485(-)